MIKRITKIVIVSISDEVFYRQLCLASCEHCNSIQSVLIRVGYQHHFSETQKLHREDFRCRACDTLNSFITKYYVIK